MDREAVDLHAIAVEVTTSGAAGGGAFVLGADIVVSDLGDLLTTGPPAADENDT